MYHVVTNITMCRVYRHITTQSGSMYTVPDKKVHNQLMAFCISCKPNPSLYYDGTHRALYRLVQIERPKLCAREFLTPFFRVRPRNFAHIFWKAVSKTRRGGFFYLGFRCRDIRVLIPPRVKYSSRDPE